MKKSCKIFLLFLMMSVSVFAKNNKKEDKDKTTIIVTGLMEGDVTYGDFTGKGNDIFNFTSTFLKGGNKLEITFTGNNAKSGDIIEKYILSGEKIHQEERKNMDDIITYSLKAKNVGEIVSLMFYVNNGNGGGGGATSFIKIVYTVTKPKEVEIKTYEEVSGGDIITLGSEPNIYKFTKGGSGSYIKEPTIYVIVPVSDSEEEEIKELKIEKLDEDGKKVGTSEIVTSDKEYNDGSENIKITSEVNNENKELSMKFGFKEGANTVQVTSTNGAGDKVTKKLNFVVDTQVNDTYLGNGIIGELDSDGKIKINLSEIKELSGIDRYTYTLKVGDKTEIEAEKEEESLKRTSFISPDRGSITKKNGEDKIVKISTSGLIPGSKGTLLFTIYDKLGHERTYEKTYFLPENSTGILSKVEGEIKQRSSRIKIVTEGNKDKFGIESNIEGSSE